MHAALAGKKKFKPGAGFIALLIILPLAVASADIKTHLSPSEMIEEQDKIRELLVDKTNYDVEITLEETTRGYNISVANLADVDSLKSYVDPIMVALVLGAWHTETTDWKSESLKVWIRPDIGWGVLTEDCRNAERKATNWYYGINLGVNPYKFRKEIETDFFRLEPPPGTRGTPPWIWPLIFGILAFLFLLAAAFFFLMWKNVFRFPVKPKPAKKKKPESPPSEEQADKK